VEEESLQAALQGNNLGLARTKELSLSFIRMRPNTLFRLLCCYQNLKKFYYEDRLGEGADHRNELHRFKNNNLMAKASRITPHLQDLTILNMGYIWSSVVTSSMSFFAPLTSSLAPFTNLRRLETTWPIVTCSSYTDVETAALLSSQSIADAIPPSLEQLYISAESDRTQFRHDVALDVIFKLLQQKHRRPALKTLNLGWMKDPYLGKNKTDKILYHRGFTAEDCLEVIARCQEAGLELILKSLAPPGTKYICYYVDDDGNKTASGTNEVQHIVHYPYDDYERICNENGCDLKTGRPDGWAMQSRY
jgi:hypothetical protein